MAEIAGLNYRSYLNSELKNCLSQQRNLRKRHKELPVGITIDDFKELNAIIARERINLEEQIRMNYENIKLKGTFDGMFISRILAEMMSYYEGIEYVSQTCELTYDSELAGLNNQRNILAIVQKKHMQKAYNYASSNNKKGVGDLTKEGKMLILKEYQGVLHPFNIMFFNYDSGLLFDHHPITDSVKYKTFRYVEEFMYRVINEKIITNNNSISNKQILNIMKQFFIDNKVIIEANYNKEILSCKMATRNNLSNNEFETKKTNLLAQYEYVTGSKRK